MFWGSNCEWRNPRRENGHSRNSGGCTFEDRSRGHEYVTQYIHAACLLTVGLVWAHGQTDPAQGWLVSRTSMLVFHLWDCGLQPKSVRDQALQEASLTSPSCLTSIRHCPWCPLDPLAHHSWSFRINVPHAHSLSTSVYPICWPIFPSHVPTIDKHIFPINSGTKSSSFQCHSCHIFLLCIQMSLSLRLFTFAPTFLSRVCSHWTWMVERRAGNVWDCNCMLNSQCWVAAVVGWKSWMACTMQAIPSECEESIMQGADTAPDSGNTQGLQTGCTGMVLRIGGNSLIWWVDGQ